MPLSDLLAVPDVRRLADAIRRGDRSSQAMWWDKLKKVLALVDPKTLKGKPKK